MADASDNAWSDQILKFKNNQKITKNLRTGRQVDSRVFTTIFKSKVGCIALLHFVGCI